MSTNDIKNQGFSTDVLKMRFYLISIKFRNDLNANKVNIVVQYSYT